MGSIRLRLVDWLQRIRDHISKGRMQALRDSQVHAQSCANSGLGCIPGIYDRSGQGQVEIAAVLADLCDPINKLDANVALDNHPSLFAYLKGLAGPKNRLDLVSQFNLPQNQNLNVSNLNANAVGVES